MIGVIGLGHVGLVLATCLSQKQTVYGYDTVEEKMKNLASNILPFYEPQLEDLYNHQHKKGFFLSNLKLLVENCDIIFLCLPVKTEDKNEDVEYLVQEIKKILDLSKTHKIIVIKSTVLPGTCSKLKQLLWKYDFDLIMSPEFSTEGSAVSDFFKERVVLGVSLGTKEEDIPECLLPISRENLVITNYETAEFIKYLSNCLLATMISFSNEMANIAETLGNIDIKTAFETLHKDRRFKDGSIKNWVYPGCGYGGYCLPKDTIALANEIIRKNGQAPLLKQTIKTNSDRIYEFIKKIVRETSGEKIQKIGILGLSFKFETSDIRNSVAIPMVENILESQYSVIAYDPLAMEEFKKLFPDIEYASSVDDLIARADLVVVLNKNPEYKKVKYSKKPYIDGRYFID